MKKVISFMLALTIVFTSFAFNVNAAEMNSNEMNSEDFIGYMEGVPVTKSDINEDGQIINENKLELIARASEKSPSYGILDSIPSLKKQRKSTLIVPVGTNVYLERVESAPRYSQTTYQYYLTCEEGRQFAKKIPMTKAKGLALFLVSLVEAPYGAMVSGATLIYGWRQSDLCDKIREYTDDSKSVKINVVNSTYGTFYGVFEWDGRNVDVTNYNDNKGNTSTVKRKYYK